jgi:hypothetical protein
MPSVGLQPVSCPHHDGAGCTEQTVNFSDGSGQSDERASHRAGQRHPAPRAFSGRRIGSQQTHFWVRLGRVPLRRQLTGRLVEALATGLAFAALLCWGSTALVGSFRPHSLPEPYWAAAPFLHTDTLGIVAFAIAAVCFPVSEYLRLRRRAPIRSGARVRSTGERARPPDDPAVLVLQAVAGPAAILAVLLVGYLSVNAVTHPATLLIQATHVLPWPSEGTLRVVALLLALAAVSVLRFLRSSDAPSGACLHLEESDKLDRQVVSQEPENCADRFMPHRTQEQSVADREK